MIRYATDEDVEDIVTCVKEYAKEAGGWFFDINEEVCKQEAQKDIPNTIIAEKDGKVIGLAIMELIRIKWSGEVILSDKLLFVKEDHRRTGAGLKLIDAMKSAADHIKLQLLTTSFNGKDIEGKDRLYTKKGFKHLGGIYLYEGRKQ